ncbi:MAG: hypothetical protein ABSH24_37180, partial [Bryobacteraceae bacterium]
PELTDGTHVATRKVEQHLRRNAMANSKDVVITGVSTDTLPVVDETGRVTDLYDPLVLLRIVFGQTEFKEH